MRFKDFESRVKTLPAFSLNDVRKIDPGFHRQQLTDWQDRKYIKPLAGGYYMLAEQQVDEDYLFMIANRIYEPSYISLESALAYHQVIPESALGIISVSSRKTRKFESDWGRFNYRSVKPVLMFGYQVMEIRHGVKYKLARVEKAVLDYLYLNTGMNSRLDFEGLRWNRSLLQPIESNPIFQKYLEIFNSKALNSRVGKFLEYLYA